MVQINGVEKTQYDGKTLEDVLAGEGYEKNRIAMEVNEEIIPKANYGEVFLKDGDRVEIVSFVGGGC
ncbi:MAG: sulfur carrier protein ThiS [Eubacterium sp.]